MVDRVIGTTSVNHDHEEWVNGVATAAAPVVTAATALLLVALVYGCLRGRPGGGNGVMSTGDSWEVRKAIVARERLARRRRARKMKLIAARREMRGHG